jgi:glycosyltransferase involved in cell wall biosynthesis
MILGGAQENTLLTLECLKKATPWELHLAHGPEFDEGDLAKEAEELGVRLHLVRSMQRNLNPVNDFKCYMELVRFFSKNKFDLVHTHSSKAGIIGRIAARDAGVTRIVHTIHGLAFDLYQPAWKNLLFRSAEQIASSHCDAIVSVCETMKKAAIDAGLGSASSIRTIYSGFDLEPYLKIDKRASDGRFVVGTIARMFPHKGHEDLMKLAPQLLEKRENLDFLIVGDGPLRAAWDDWLREYPQWKDRFTFPGRISREDVPMYLSRMDAFLHLSWREGLPRTVAQALAAAKPVCVYDIGGTCEIVDDGVTGFLVSPGDFEGIIRGVEQIRGHPKAARIMGENGREKVRSLFSLEKMRDDILHLYRNLGIQ